MAPLDYKFTEYKEINYKTYKMQSLIYGLLISENYKKEVNKGYIIYTRSKNKLITIDFKSCDYEKLNKIIEEMLLIITKGYFPKRTSNKIKCMDCTYNRICV
jgi:CRISPR-associated exonuclease Cas4